MLFGVGVLHPTWSLLSYGERVERAKCWLSQAEQSEQVLDRARIHASSGAARLDFASNFQQLTRPHLHIEAGIWWEWRFL